MKPFFLFIVSAGLFLMVSSARGQQVPPYKNASLPTETRVRDLLSRMTLEEKVAQMLCLWQGKRQITDADGRFDAEKAKTSGVFRNGLGRIERPSDNHGPREQAEYVNAIQRFVSENTRLAIPVLFHEEALHGLQGPGATSFPQAIALASSWDPGLVQQVFNATAAEIRARGGHQVLAPVVDVAREPRWGRFEETYGEDPYLAARMGVAAVQGFQGQRGPVIDRIDDTHVIATLKHMSGHGQPESGTNVGPANYSERVLREVFFYPFEVAVKEAGALSLMASYNEVDGVPSHANTWMLRDVLRNEWGFRGTIVSDWNAIEQLRSIHHVAADAPEAARRALAATVDIELPDIETFDTLVDQVKNGTVHQADVDTAVVRLLRAKFMLGLFENPYVDPDHAERLSRSEQHRALAADAARRSIILLKNEGGILPLNRAKIQSIAVIGPHSAETLLGGYSGRPYEPVSVLQGIIRKAGPAIDVRHAEGTRITEDSVFTKEAVPLKGGERSMPRWQSDRIVLTSAESNEARIQEAVRVASESDVVVLVLGENEQVSREAWAKNHLGDRTDLDLLGRQDDLVRAIVATGKPVVALMLHGRPLAINTVVEQVPAILDGWYLGQETGTAVADVLFGDVNPGGKLTSTVPRSVGQLPVFYNHKPSALRGYAFDTTSPLFSFGHGLSYTTFAIGDPVLSRSIIRKNESVSVTVPVANTGSRAGDEVVQLYIRDDVSAVTRPVKELKGFERVTLRPGENREVRFTITPEHLQYYGPGMRRIVEPGTFTIMVGPNSVDLKTVKLTVTD